MVSTSPRSRGLQLAHRPLVLPPPGCGCAVCGAWRSPPWRATIWPAAPPAARPATTVATSCYAWTRRQQVDRAPWSRAFGTVVGERRGRFASGGSSGLPDRAASSTSVPPPEGGDGGTPRCSSTVGVFDTSRADFRLPSGTPSRHDTGSRLPAVVSHGHLARRYWALRYLTRRAKARVKALGGQQAFVESSAKFPPNRQHRTSGRGGDPSSVISLEQGGAAADTATGVPADPTGKRRSPVPDFGTCGSTTAVDRRLFGDPTQQFHRQLARRRRQDRRASQNCRDGARDLVATFRRGGEGCSYRGPVQPTTPTRSPASAAVRVRGAGVSVRCTGRGLPGCQPSEAADGVPLRVRLGCVLGSEDSTPG